MIDLTGRLSAEQALDRRTFFKEADESPREHSRRLDRQLGFNIRKIEHKLAKNFRHFSHEDLGADKDPYQENREGWIGLDPQVLLTPYAELATIFETLIESHHHIDSIVDFGCAYGRVGLVSSVYFSKAKFTGYEFVSPRIKEARRVFELQKLSNYELIEVDILCDSFEFPTASLYFIYDFGRISALKHILNQLVARKGNQDFILIARGEEVQSLILNFLDGFEKEKICRGKKYLIYTHQRKDLQTDSTRASLT